MSQPSRGRAAVKLIFWAAVAAALVAVVFHSYESGQMAGWYYHTASLDGYAVNASGFLDATPDDPAILAIQDAVSIDGAVAVPVKKGDRLPRNATGIISEEVLAKGRRAHVEGQTVVVSVPWEIKESKGFKFRDTFKHKGIRTYPWAAVWNVVMTLALGLSLGLMAEGLTDLLGIRFEKIRHFGH